MILRDGDLKLLSQAAVIAALKAGEHVAGSFGGDIDVLSKEGGDSYASRIVTEVDLESQSIILDSLNSITEQFDLGILCEESGDDESRFRKDYFWSIDPLDGTLPFTKSISGFSISIALLTRSGAPLIGVIYDPYGKNLYHGIKSAGAFRNDNKWEIDRSGKTFSLIYDSSFAHHPLYEKTVGLLERTVSSKGYSLELVSQGGAAMNAMWTLEKSPALYFKYPRKKKGGGSLWDYAASSLIVSESGGVVSDFFGNPLELNSSSSLYMNRSGVFYASSDTVKYLVYDELKSIFSNHSGK